MRMRRAVSSRCQQQMGLPLECTRPTLTSWVALLGQTSDRVTEPRCDCVSRTTDHTESTVHRRPSSQSGNQPTSISEAPSGLRDLLAGCLSPAGRNRPATARDHGRGKNKGNVEGTVDLVRCQWSLTWTRVTGWAPGDACRVFRQVERREPVCPLVLVDGRGTIASLTHSHIPSNVPINPTSWDMTSVHRRPFTMQLSVPARTRNTVEASGWRNLTRYMIRIG